MTLLGVDQRRAGTAHSVFGVIGIVLAGLIALALVGTAVAARDLDERLMAEQAQLADTLEDLATTTRRRGDLDGERIDDARDVERLDPACA